MPTKKPHKAKKEIKPRTLAEAQATDSMFYINKCGFSRHRDDLIECGYDPDDPADMSMCEWLVNGWDKDD